MDVNTMFEENLVISVYFNEDTKLLEIETFERCEDEEISEELKARSLKLGADYYVRVGLTWLKPHNLVEYSKVFQQVTKKYSPKLNS